jgi:hypothetical protein
MFCRRCTEYFQFDQTYRHHRKIVIVEVLLRRIRLEGWVGFWGQLADEGALALADKLVASCFLWSRDRLILFDVEVNLNLIFLEEVFCRLIRE